MDRIYLIDYRGSARHVVERDGTFRALEGSLFGAYSLGEEVAQATRPGDPPTGFRMLPPVRPSKIVGVGLNYRDHAAETHKPLPTEPLIFLKPSTAVIGPDEPVRLPPVSARVDHEAELGVVIGRTARHVPRARAHEYILGLTCVNDVTARDMQNRGVQYSHCKGFDTFAPLGPCVAVGLDGSALGVEGWVNGTRRQASNTRELIFPVDELVAFISSVMTLLPGDVISTGTPAGIGPLSPGDRVSVRVEGIGELSNPVEAA
jgi:2-keto-4-pentenoate hydratase/2-oxohepta-3-ene-1,7-dioic acid hydratase in catechol pathway